jgi:small neutral amino acid transporter SnatA (MarC family)
MFLSTSASKPAISTLDTVARAAVVICFATAMEIQSRRRVLLGASATNFYIFLLVALVYWLSGLALSHL